ncbi:MAG: penicillin acylase family protein [Vicinamibacteria bacterium]|nr:penicillin acylase family protein [Vicinamibacteria bacterium]
MRRFDRFVFAVLVVLALAAAALLHFTRRALPERDADRRVDGLAAPVEVVRDRWGVPHVFAADADGTAFGLGYAHVQDRLFQMETLRLVTQGRLAELFGARAVEVDRMFRTLDLHGLGQRQLARARPEVRAAFEAYARGANAAQREIGGRLPPEFALLGHKPELFAADDFLGIVGYMAWSLQISWHFDPLYEDTVARLGPQRTAELFPYNWGARPSTFPAPAPTPGASAARLASTDRALNALRPTLFALSREADELLGLVGEPRASNNWAIAPGRSASGHALLANDPHLSHGLPGIWYQAHLQGGELDVIGVTIPGLPFVAIGHNRDVGWGFTNLMQDAGDFFVEELSAGQPGHVRHRGAWVPIEERHETIRVRGGADVKLTVRRTPHGPLVSDLLPGSPAGLSFQWVMDAATHANEAEGFYLLNRARDWDGFRDALSRFGALAQNVVYADRAGHIGMQTAGALPRFLGPQEGTRIRRGDGSEDWDGFWPFADNPSVFDPAQGYVASANSPTVAPPAKYYISSQWEPFDRFVRINEVLGGKPKLDLDDLRGLHVDDLWVTARAWTPRIVAAFSEQPPGDPRVARALELLRGFDGRMRVDSAAATVFATFYRRLFYEVFEDELGPELAKRYRARANVSSLMLRAVLDDGARHWLDRIDTREVVEDEAAVMRAALARAVAELSVDLGGAPASWTWGRVHTLTLTHPLAAGGAPLAAYFNRGPVALPGATHTVAKAEYREGSFAVAHGPSMRQLTDMGDVARAHGVIPAGQSGIPTSPHYDDLFPLWLRGEYHPLLMDRADIAKAEAGRLVLRPR